MPVEPGGILAFLEIAVKGTFATDCYAVVNRYRVFDAPMGNGQIVWLIKLDTWTGVTSVGHPIGAEGGRTWYQFVDGPTATEIYKARGAALLEWARTELATATRPASAP